MATVEDCGHVNSLVERRIEDTGHLSVANIEAALVGIGGNQSAVCMDILAARENGELGSLAVDAKRTVAGIVKNHRVATLRQVNKIFLHGGKNAVMIGLRGR